MISKIVVSRCLNGEACRYDGGAKGDEAIMRLVSQGVAVCVCPEQMGKMDTPRRPSEIAGGDGLDVLNGRARVKNDAGADVTEQFISGAYAALEAAKAAGAQRAILKARSPSCGCSVIYDGTFTGKLKKGDGVTAALFKLNGIEVETR